MPNTITIETAKFEALLTNIYINNYLESKEKFVNYCFHEFNLSVGFYAGSDAVVIISQLN